MSLMSRGNDIMRLEHHLVGGYVRYISPHIIILLLLKLNNQHVRDVAKSVGRKLIFTSQ